MRSAENALTRIEDLDERDLVSAARAGDERAFREIMRCNSRRLYRVARGVLRDDADAEDAVQDGYVRAFSKLADFRAEAALSTWLTRIVLNEALMRLRRRRPTCDLADIEEWRETPSNIVAFPMSQQPLNPEAEASRAEVRRILERAVDDLPEAFRVVFVMRALEEMTVEETASQLGLRPETVKTRLHRARKLLRTVLHERMASALTDAFPFEGARCARIADRVVERMGSTKA